MPQMCRTRRLGVALDFDMTKTPAPVYIDTVKNNSRDYRRDVKDRTNMLLNDVRPVNDLHPRHWQGNGFAGNVQFTTYIGRDRLRPGEKLERDIQMNTMPKENAKPLNTSQMPTRSTGNLQFQRDLEHREIDAHANATASLQKIRSVACTLHREEDGHNHHRSQVELNRQRQERINEVAAALPGLRPAGLAGINPRLGTSGSLPNLTGLQGSGGIDQWRTSAPWAHGGHWDSTSTWAL
eukprot:TRINITY_DN23801_c0_g1_i1.p1 TRINITY_DN23801_c0_g1~~TRINITY_DN23801_c0_g1_i1.p1  ORF type:complete len:238 (-),score=29.18 TRINITY_DN23801_c0_g1_i1:665-1378(-)